MKKIDLKGYEVVECDEGIAGLILKDRRVKYDTVIAKEETINYFSDKKGKVAQYIKPFKKLKIWKKGYIFYANQYVK